MTMSDPMIGKRLGDYRLVKELGRGGMGVVYEAVHDRVGQRIAIKTLSEEMGQHFPCRERFLREAVARSRVSHEGLVKIFGCGEDPGGTVFLLMELLEGQSLRMQLDTAPDRRLPLQEALRIALEIAMSLEALHRAGVVHRDLKPSNIMIVTDSAVPTGLRTKLLDFGIAKLLNMPDMPTLSGGSTPGTPTYMSPEQCHGDASLDGRSDVYSLGVLLYEMLCGRPPFVGEPEQLLLFHIAQAPQSLRQRISAISPSLDALVLRMLRKRPVERPQIEDVIRELGHLLASGNSGHRRRIARVSGILFARWLFMPILLLAVLALAELVYYVSHRKLWVSAESEMALIQGSTITLGSTAQEVTVAFEWAKWSGCADCPLSLYQREFPQKKVTLTSFYMDRHEVTNAQFSVWLNQLNDQKLLEADAAEQLFSLHSMLLINIHPDYGYSGVIYHSGRFETRAGMANRPVTQVTWDGARSYCQQYGKTLPTEAQWELAARGLSGRRFPWGDDDPRCDGVVFARLSRLRCENAGSGPADVGSLPQDKTPEGIRDLGGNVAEWTEDTFRLHYLDCADSACRDPVVRDNSDADGGPEMRVVRGGAWYRPADSTRAAGRQKGLRSDTLGDTGFRCVRAKKQSR